MQAMRIFPGGFGTVISGPRNPWLFVENCSIMTVVVNVFNTTFGLNRLTPGRYKESLNARNTPRSSPCSTKGCIETFTRLAVSIQCTGSVTRGRSDPDNTCCRALRSDNAFDSSVRGAPSKDDSPLSRESPCNGAP
ncbi:MAG: hypothetical protein BWY09_00436 [Candidatus Hydrogenedentes bacterium ADurb.Bin179]|nr:MAG: hypothetical protein BWY09_00436 [Candidatus Hydrogenedentes bacterium ADurb.Bin179]